MKRLLGWIIILAIAIGVFTLFVNWREERARVAAQHEREQARVRAEAEAQRQQLIAAPPQEASTGNSSSLPQVNAQHEYRFRQLAEQNRVEVLEYRAVARREVLVRLRTRNQTGIGDLLDAAIREGIVLDFDDRMQSQNNQTAVDPQSGAYIWETRFTFREG